MQIVSTDGRFHAYDFPAGELLSSAQVMATLERHVNEADGTINSLCLDFCGSYVPIGHRSELHLVCALVCAYNNTAEARFNEVRARRSCLRDVSRCRTRVRARAGERATGRPRT